MVTAKVFQSGNSQAIRIPKEYHTTEKEFYIRQYNGGFYLIPTSDPWKLLRNSIGAAEDLDFERDQPSILQLSESEEF